LAVVVEAQIGGGGPAAAAAARSPASRRRAARAQATYGRLLNRLRAETGLATSEEAETALEVVIGSLVRRLTPGEADDLIAQLPSLLQPTLRALPPGPDKLVTRQAIEAELGERLGVSPARAAELLDAVGATVAQAVSPGQILDVQGQLPEELRGVLPVPQAG
jgi:uncharacterized protein (DUF2267 family)